MLTLLVVLGAAYQAMAQDAPLDQYIMTDQGAEIALARSAAPESISRNASVLVLRTKAQTDETIRRPTLPPGERDCRVLPSWLRATHRST